jgi:hypothetical protein
VATVVAVVRNVNLEAHVVVNGSTNSVAYSDASAGTSQVRTSPLGENVVQPILLRNCLHTREVIHNVRSVIDMCSAACICASHHHEAEKTTRVDMVRQEAGESLHTCVEMKSNGTVPFGLLLPLDLFWQKSMNAWRQSFPPQVPKQPAGPPTCSRGDARFSARAAWLYSSKYSAGLPHQSPSGLAFGSCAVGCCQSPVVCRHVYGYMIVNHSTSAQRGQS